MGEACGKTANKLNLEIVWSVFAPEDQFWTSSRFMYRSIRKLNRGTRLWGPSRRGFYAANMWGKESNKAAAAIKAAFLRGEEDPDKDLDLQRRCMGHPGRDERIYGFIRIPLSPVILSPLYRPLAVYRCRCRSQQLWKGVLFRLRAKILRRPFFYR